MLKMKQTPHITLPKPKLFSKAMQFSPVVAEADELIEDIEQTLSADEDKWSLTERPDSDELESYWNGVVADVRKDPDWIAIDE